ncbi:hypothetical protein P186_0950 [Pyrobaculum ferrireducens]|uniref:Uncharacterized protein n=1 Tax=Pyrobaculum ferrireducens TaxID=1104324 RepID=G7VBG1_9CREN|nr:hypothetical protein P186_0950 [Pyrobaculum ferrireducens]
MYLKKRIERSSTPISHAPTTSSLYLKKRIESDVSVCGCQQIPNRVQYLKKRIERGQVSRERS